MPKGGFAVTISATDLASPTLAAVNKQIAALRKPAEDANAYLQRLGKQFGTLGRATGVDVALGAAGRSFKAVGAAAGAATSAVTKFAPALGALTAAGTVAGLASLVQNFGLMGQSLLNAANRAGMATDQLQALENGARIAGVAAGTMTAGVTALRDNLVDAVGGRAPEFIRMMQSLGLAWQDGAGHARDVSAALPEIADRIAMIKDPTLQARAATALFGGAAEAMLPYLRRGSAGMEEYRRKAIQYGVVNEEAAHQAQLLRESQAEVSLAVEGLGNSIAATLGPVLSPMLHDLSLWIAANRDWIASDITDMVKALADAIKGVDWKSVSRSIVNTAEAVTGLVKALTTGDPGAGLIAFFEKMTGWKVPEIVKRLLLSRVDAPTVSLTPRGQGPGNPWTLGFPGAPAAPEAPAPGPTWLQRNFPWLFGGVSPGAIGRARIGMPGYLGPTGAPLSEATPGPTQFAGPGTQGGGGLRNMRNNNPTNLTFAGQPGAANQNGMAQFPNLETGTAADLNQLLLYQDRDNLRSVEQMIYRATPPGPENPGVEGYIDRVAAQLGVKRNDPVNMHDPTFAQRYIMAVAKEEGGVPDPDAVKRGVAMRLGVPAAPALAGPVYGPPAPAPVASAPTPGPSGKANLTVRLAGFPESTMTAATTSGDLWDNTPIIERAMPMTASR